MESRLFFKTSDRYYSSFLSNNQTSIGETEAPSDHNSIIIETGEMNVSSLEAERVPQMNKGGTTPRMNRGVVYI